MNYTLLHDVIDLIEKFEQEQTSQSSQTLHDFINWTSINKSISTSPENNDWEGKDKGRSAESVISTLLVHMNRYAKSYSKSAIANSPFSTQDEFIYLINLRAFGSMSKMSLIKLNKQEKPAGMQTINRLISMGWVHQIDSPTDKRSKILSITSAGEYTLDNQMGKIRKATQIVTGTLTNDEKNDLIRILNKLDNFHKEIYDKNISSDELLLKAFDIYSEAQKKAH